VVASNGHNATDHVVLPGLRGRVPVLPPFAANPLVGQDATLMQPGHRDDPGQSEPLTPVARLNTCANDPGRRCRAGLRREGARHGAQLRCPADNRPRGSAARRAARDPRRGDASSVTSVPMGTGSAACDQAWLHVVSGESGPPVRRPCHDFFVTSVGRGDLSDSTILCSDRHCGCRDRARGAGGSIAGRPVRPSVFQPN
jgi:hypothetical protein